MTLPILDIVSERTGLGGSRRSPSDGCRRPVPRSRFSRTPVSQPPRSTASPSASNTCSSATAHSSLVAASVPGPKSHSESASERMCRTKRPRCARASTDSVFVTFGGARGCFAGRNRGTLSRPDLDCVPRPRPRSGARDVEYASWRMRYAHMKGRRNTYNNVMPLSSKSTGMAL
ncbi:unnamed protein product, partial [Mycena citricolor]